MPWINSGLVILIVYLLIETFRLIKKQRELRVLINNPNKEKIESAYTYVKAGRMDLAMECLRSVDGSFWARGVYAELEDSVNALLLSEAIQKPNDLTENDITILRTCAEQFNFLHKVKSVLKVYMEWQNANYEDQIPSPHYSLSTLQNTISDMGNRITNILKEQEGFESRWDK